MGRSRPGRRKRTALTVLAVFGIVLFSALGIWQVERKAWKEDLIDMLTRRLESDPAELPPPAGWSRLDAGNAEFRRVRLNVQFQKANDALVYTSGSQIRDDVKGQGFFVFSPARFSGGATIVINRGFVPGDRRDPAGAGGDQQTRQGIVPGIARIGGHTFADHRSTGAGRGGEPGEEHPVLLDTGGDGVEVTGLHRSHEAREAGLGAREELLVVEGSGGHELIAVDQRHAPARVVDQRLAIIVDCLDADVTPVAHAVEDERAAHRVPHFLEHVDRLGRRRGGDRGHRGRGGGRGGAAVSGLRESSQRRERRPSAAVDEEVGARTRGRTGAYRRVALVRARHRRVDGAAGRESE